MPDSGTRNREIALTVPTGHCRRCNSRVPLNSLALPSLMRRGAIVVKGSCEHCGQSVAAFYAGNPIDDLQGARLSPVYSAIMVMGMKAGYKAGQEGSQARRNDDILRVQQRLDLSYRGLAPLFNLSIGRVGAALADARRRAVDSKLQDEIRKASRTKTLGRLAEQFGLSKQEIRDAIAQARQRQDDEDLDARMLAWRDGRLRTRLGQRNRTRGWSYARIARKFGLDRMEVRDRVKEARRRANKHTVR